jgi:hypothetical protein
MPKQLTRYDTSININVETDLKRRIRALAWIHGYEGRMSILARGFLREKVGESVSALIPKHKAEFDAVMANLEQEDLLLQQIAEDDGELAQPHDEKEIVDEGEPQENEPDILFTG